MIKFQRITTTDAALYKYMEQLMTASFPSEEYRPLEGMRNYTDRKGHFCNIILLDIKILSVCLPTGISDFYYLEHFAIYPKQRNGGYRKATL